MASPKSGKFEKINMVQLYSSNNNKKHDLRTNRTKIEIKVTFFYLHVGKTLSSKGANKIKSNRDLESLSVVLKISLYWDQKRSEKILDRLFRFWKTPSSIYKFEHTHGEFGEAADQKNRRRLKKKLKIGEKWRSVVNNSSGQEPGWASFWLQSKRKQK